MLFFYFNSATMKYYVHILLAIIMLTAAQIKGVAQAGCTDRITNVTNFSVNYVDQICSGSGDREYRFSAANPQVGRIELKNTRVKVYASTNIIIGRVLLDNATLIVFSQGKVNFYNSSVGSCTGPVIGPVTVQYDIDIRNNSKFIVAANGVIDTKNVFAPADVKYARRIGVMNNSKLKFFSCSDVSIYCDRMNVGYCYYAGNASPSHSCETGDAQSSTDKSYVEVLSAGKVYFSRGDFYRRSQGKFICHGKGISFGDLGMNYSVRFPVTQVPSSADLEGIIWLAQNAIVSQPPASGNVVSVSYGYAGVDLGDLWAWGRFMLDASLSPDFYCPAICSVAGQVNWNFDVGPTDPFRRAENSGIVEIKPSEPISPVKDNMVIGVTPNPASDKFVLRLESGNKLPENIEMQLVSAQGKVMLARRLPVQPGASFFAETIDITAVPPGVYVLNILLLGQKPEAHKLIITRN
jgi:hypothetical protein